MKVILVFVSTLDGKATRWDDPEVRNWSSESDQEYFTAIWRESPLIVMGANTFKADPPKPSAGKLIVVMTSRPDSYKKFEVSGQLEFLDVTPRQLLLLYEKGYSQMLVVGGPHIAAAFLKEELIDELWLTIEPRIFGMGSDFVANEKLDVHLQLLSCKKVNDNGTLITRYSVRRTEN
jgi:dihydrofolate reductase